MAAPGSDLSRRLQTKEQFTQGEQITFILTDLTFPEQAGSADDNNIVQTAVKTPLIRGHEKGICLRLIR